MEVVYLEAIPSGLQWEHQPLAWQVVDDGRGITITAGGSTDLFNDPQGAVPIDNSPRLMFEPEGNFTLSVKVKVAFGSTFDAGVLLIYADADRWAKLCFEFSPQREPMVVSVVTRTLSDDCNSSIIDGEEIFLRVARIDQAFAFHFSRDGEFWHLVRLFSLGEGAFRIGFSAQSPTGEACAVSFREIEFTERRLQNVRSGE
jgi:regulation of enolase protein 1 (concanavalin A-like superfamily)